MVSCSQKRILLILSFKAPHCPNCVHSFHFHLTFPPAHRPLPFHLSKSYPSFTSMKSWPPALPLLHLMPQALPHCDELCVRSPTSFWAARGASVVPKVLLAHKNFQVALVHAGISCFIYLPVRQNSLLILLFRYVTFCFLFASLDNNK